MQNNIKKIPSSKLFSMAENSFDNGKSIIITVVGNSMYPFLRNNVDSVELYRESYDNIKKRDIIVGRKDDKYILHRLYKKSETEFTMLGDGNQHIDGPYAKDDFICKASAIYRKNKKIICTSLTYRFLVRIWWILHPFRMRIIRLYKKLRRNKH